MGRVSETYANKSIRPSEYAYAYSPKVLWIYFIEEDLLFCDRTNRQFYFTKIATPPQHQTGFLPLLKHTVASKNPPASFVASDANAPRRRVDSKMIAFL